MSRVGLAEHKPEGREGAARQRIGGPAPQQVNGAESWCRLGGGWGEGGAPGPRGRRGRKVQVMLSATGFGKGLDYMPRAVGIREMVSEQKWPE